MSGRNSTSPGMDSDGAGWAALAPDDALLQCHTTRAGLTEREAAERLKIHGPNVPPRVVGTPLHVEFIRNFIHLFALLLWAGAVLAWLAGLPELAWAIVAVIVVNGLFGFWQEYQAERAAEALVALLPRQVTVRRDGEEQLIGADRVVPGDVLILTEGEAIPADARLISAHRLRVDASTLTGESRPVPRSVEPTDPTGRPTISLPNIVFAGTSVVGGRGEAVVFAVGKNTEFGHIAELTQAQTEQLSPLQRELQKVTRIVTLLAVGFGLLFFVVGTSLAGLSLVEAFLFAVGIIVANVPEGLLPTLTLALALGVRRMAKRKALVKRLSAVETLGATTVILTDKTGTLTENEMTVRELWADGRLFPVSGVGYDPTGEINFADADSETRAAVIEMLRTAALCCDATVRPPNDERKHWKLIGDPTEGAILVAAMKIGLTPEALAAFPRVEELPFDSTRKRMTIIHRFGDAETACVKGAPSELMPRCARIRRNGSDAPFDDAERKGVQAAHDALAGRGLRVLAIASRAVDPDEARQPETVETDLTLLGLVAMQDPPRPEVPAAIAACRRASIRVAMVTGDNGLTAAAVGREIGLHDDQVRIVTGGELDSLSDSELDRVLDLPDVLFARVSPEHKLRLVEAFQKRGDVVAVTGDGVNDAPALKRADIGVAMGLSGTDVARESADIVLTDDNFAAIIDAVREGRAVYDNIRKFITYIFASNSAEMMPFVAFALFRIPLPLTIMQVLAIDVGTDLLPALALGAEAPEPDVMDRPPRKRTERLLNPPTLIRAYAWFGMLEALFGFLGFFFVYRSAGWTAGVPLADSGPLYLTATTMMLAGIVAGQVGNVFACRSERETIAQIGFLSNRMVFPCVAAEIALLSAIIYVPPLARAFGTAPLGLEHWLFLAVFPPTLLALEEIRKRLMRMYAPTNSA